MAHTSSTGPPGCGRDPARRRREQQVIVYGAFATGADDEVGDPIGVEVAVEQHIAAVPR